MILNLIYKIRPILVQLLAEFRVIPRRNKQMPE
jgi:hypothetical protein